MKKQISANGIGWWYAFAHFSVEVVCFYFLFSRLGDSPYWWGLALLYDALAFVPQSFLGIWLDHHPRLNFGGIGGTMLILALFLPWNWIAFPILTIGNALVHVGGAQYTLCTAKGKLSPSSIFVGGGSFGVITGQLLGKNAGAFTWLIPLGLMAFATVVFVVIHRICVVDNTAEGFALDSDLPVGWLVGLTFLTVAVRAYVGYAIPTEWNKSTGQAILLFCCMGIGKALGGVFADRFGARRTAIWSLSLALPLILFGNSAMVVSLIGVAFFSMTMPLTLGILVSRFPRMPGLSFGITTVGLFVGSMPAFFVQPKGLLAHQIVVTILTFVALLAFLLCMRKEKTYETA